MTRYVSFSCDREDMKKMFNEFSKEKFERILKLMREDVGRSEILDIVKCECSRMGITTGSMAPKGVPIMQFDREIMEKTGKKPSIVDAIMLMHIEIANKILSKNLDLGENYLEILLKSIFKIKLENKYYFTLDLKHFLKELTEDENYLDVVLIIKIISELKDLPLKGKSIEEYKKAIVSECNKMLDEENEQ